MSIRLSDAATALLAGDTGLRLGTSNFYLDFFVGTQPTYANDAEAGQKIISFRKATAGVDVFIADVQAQWKVTLSGTSGSLTTVKIAGWDILGGTIAFATTLTALAAAAALQINNFIGNSNFTASSNGADLYVIAPRANGTSWNALAVTATVSGGDLAATIASTGYPATSNGTAGVAAAYACNWLVPVDGLTLATPLQVWQLQQEAATWSGKAGYDATNTAISGYTSGNLTAGWARLKTSLADTGAATSGATGYIRVDWSVGTTSASDIVMSPSAQFAFGTINYLTGLVLNVPKL